MAQRKKQRRRPGGLGNFAPPRAVTGAKSRRITLKQYSRLLDKHNLAPLSAGDCRTLQHRRDGKKRTLSLCLVTPHAPILIVGRK